MSNSWDRPDTGSPFKAGDLEPDKIYLAVGRALSKWERLEAAMVQLYASVTGIEDYYLDAPAIRAFGMITSPSTRADMISQAANTLFHYLGFQAGIEPSDGDTMEGEAIETELRSILSNYRGWMARRNDVAHGYVDTRELPDATQESSPPVTSSLLLPSDGSAAKWCIIVGEPAYAYVSADIEKFGVAFEALEGRARLFSDRLRRYRQGLLAKPPKE